MVLISYESFFLFPVISYDISDRAPKVPCMILIIGFCLLESNGLMCSLVEESHYFGFDSFDE